MANPEITPAELPSPDWPRWIARDLWTLLEAAALLAEREPPNNALGPSDVTERIRAPSACNCFRTAYAHLKDATDLYKDNPSHPKAMHFIPGTVLEGDRPRPGRRKVSPENVIALAQSKQLPIPQPLVAAFPDQGQTGSDAGSGYPSTSGSPYSLVTTHPLEKALEDPESNEASFVGEATSSGPIARVPSKATNRKKWNDNALRELRAEYLEPGSSQQQLASKHGVSRQRISHLLKLANNKFGSKALARGRHP